MKARRFLAVVLVATLSLFGLALAGGWLVWQRSPLQLQRQALVMPRSARFVPRQASLALFLQADPERPVDYARALAPTRQRRQAAEAVASLRDGAFAAAGLDYLGELVGWLGGETGVALLASEPGGAPDGWLLALQSRDGEGARRFLQRFWQTRSLAGTGLQVSSYRGMGLISGRGALVGRDPVPIATALIDDDLVLLASGRGVLEQALDVSQIDELNLAADPVFLQSLQQLRRGALLLHARPGGLEPWLGLPAGSPSAEATPSIQSVAAALRPHGRQLELEALVALAPGVPALAPASASATAAVPDSAPSPAADDDAKPDLEAGEEKTSQGAAELPAEAASPRWQPRLAPAQASALTAGLRGELHTVALLQDPAHWPEDWRALLRRAWDPESDGPLPAQVAAADAGPLLWSRGPLGWLLATPSDQPDPETLESALAARGLVMSTVESAGPAPIQVWTHLEALPFPRRRREAGSQLALSLAGARQVEAGRAWWGQTLAVLEERRAAGDTPRDQLRDLEGLGLAEAPLQWATGSKQALAALQRWSAWRLLTGLAGQPLDSGVRGLAIALEPLPAGSGSADPALTPFLHLKANLRYG